MRLEEKKKEIARLKILFDKEVAKKTIQGAVNARMIRAQAEIVMSQHTPNFPAGGVVFDATKNYSKTE